MLHANEINRLIVARNFDHLRFVKLKWKIVAGNWFDWQLLKRTHRRKHIIISWAWIRCRIYYFTIKRKFEQRRFTTDFFAIVFLCLRPIMRSALFLFAVNRTISNFIDKRMSHSRAHSAPTRTRIRFDSIALLFVGGVNFYCRTDIYCHLMPAIEFIAHRSSSTTRRHGVDDDNNKGRQQQQNAQAQVAHSNKIQSIKIQFTAEHFFFFFARCQLPPPMSAMARDMEKRILLFLSRFGCGVGYDNVCYTFLCVIDRNDSIKTKKCILTVDEWNTKCHEADRHTILVSNPPPPAK